MSGRAALLDRCPELEALIGVQAGVIARSQLKQLGINANHVARQVQARRWAEIGPLLVAAHCGPLLGPARHWAVLLNHGQAAALASWTALGAWGLTGWERDAVHVVVPRGARPPVLPPVVGPVRVHESRRHTEDDVRVRGGLRVHSPERAAVDAGAWSRSVRTACGVLAAAVQQGLTTGDRLLAQLDTVGKVRWLRAMRGAAADISGGAQALSEMDFLAFCRRYRLPEPSQQVVRRDSAGRRRYLDATFRKRNGQVLHVEIDGVGHMEVQRWYEDLMRTAELLVAGTAEPLRLPSMAVRVEPERVARVLLALLG